MKKNNWFQKSFVVVVMVGLISCGSDDNKVTNLDGKAAASLKVTEVLVNNAAAQPDKCISKFFSAKVKVNVPVTLLPGALSFRHITRGHVVYPDVAVSSTLDGGSEILITLPHSQPLVIPGISYGSLENGRWEFRIDKELASAGDLKMSSDFKTEVKRWYLDTNGNCAIDGEDLAVYGPLFGTTFGLGNPYDYNGDGTWSGAEDSAWATPFGTSLSTYY